MGQEEDEGEAEEEAEEEEEDEMVKKKGVKGWKGANPQESNRKKLHRLQKMHRRTDARVAANANEDRREK